MNDDLVWVIGARGLLGSGVRRVLHERGRRRLMTASIPWSDSDLAIRAFESAADEFVERAAGGRWQVAWCAGTGVPATPPEVLDAENRVLGGVLDALQRRIGNGLDVHGAFFLASSAGAVYAGSPNPPYDEHSEPRPLSHYGVTKLVQEDLVRAFSHRTGVGSLIGRISNLYGPGQNLSKPQGIISQLCRAHLTGQPISIYVSMDTIRDYIFVDDCAAMALDALDLIGHGPPSGVSITKILAAQRGVTIAGILGECRRTFGRPPRVIASASPLASIQARDIRLRSVVLPEIDRRPTTTMRTGISATSEDLERALQRGLLPRR